MSNKKYNFDPHELSILVVDDQDQIRKAIRRVIQTMDFKEVIEATEATAACIAFESRRPALVVCDLNLGQTSGLSVLENIRHQNLASDIPILVVTGEAGRDDIVKAVDLGANDYLLKPFQADALEKKVIKLLEEFTSPGPLLQKIRATEKLLLAGQFKEALAPLGEAAALDAKNLRVRYLQAFTWMKMGQILNAEKILETLLAEQPGYYRGSALLADLRLKKGRVGEAVALMAAELEFNGKQPDRLIQIGELLLEQARPQDAIAYFRKALLIDQRLRGALLAMGHAQIKNGNLDKGLYYFKRLRRYYPDAREALEAIVSTCERVKDLRRAEFLLRDERASNPKQTDASVLLARVYFMQEKLEDAIAVAGELTKSGEAEEASLIMAMAEIKNDHPREALAALENIKHSKNMSYIYRLMADLHLQLKNPVKAEAAAMRSFASEPWSEHALLIQAKALTQTHDHGKAAFILLRATLLGAAADAVSTEIAEAKLALKKRRAAAAATAAKPPTRVAS